MKLIHALGLALLCGSVVLVGCQPQAAKEREKKEGKQAKGRSAEVQAALAELSAEDRKLAEAQGFCPVMDEPLGSMGKPFKVVIRDQPVFLCCKGCRTRAVNNPEKTLNKVKELQARVRSAQE